MTTFPTEQIAIRSRKQWLKARRSGIGGSDIAAIMGVNPYSTADDIAETKLTGKEKDETEPMRIGRLIEPIIVKLFAQRQPRWYISNPKMLFRKNEICLATPDRILTETDGSDQILEIKNTGYWNKDKRTMAAYQLQWYCYVLNAPGGYIAALERGSELIIQPVVRDEELIKRMVSIAHTFWSDRISGQQAIK